MNYCMHHVKDARITSYVGVWMALDEARALPNTERISSGKTRTLTNLAPVLDNINLQRLQIF